MLAKLAIWYLRKTHKSVLIGFEINSGTIKSINNDSFTYDNNLNNVDYRTSDNKSIILPEGKFSISHESNY